MSSLFSKTIIFACGCNICNGLQALEQDQVEATLEECFCAVSEATFLSTSQSGCRFSTQQCFDISRYAYELKNVFVHF